MKVTTSAAVLSLAATGAMAAPIRIPNVGGLLNGFEEGANAGSDIANILGQIFGGGHQQQQQGQGQQIQNPGAHPVQFKAKRDEQQLAEKLNINHHPWHGPALPPKFLPTISTIPIDPKTGKVFGLEAPLSLKEKRIVNPNTDINIEELLKHLHIGIPTHPKPIAIDEPHAMINKRDPGFFSGKGGSSGGGFKWNPEHVIDGSNVLANLGNAAGTIAGSVASNNANAIAQQQLQLQQQQLAAAQAAINGLPHKKRGFGFGGGKGGAGNHNHNGGSTGNHIIDGANALANLGNAAGTIAGSVASNNANAITEQQLQLQQQQMAALNALQQQQPHKKRAAGGPKTGSSGAATHTPPKEHEEATNTNKPTTADHIIDGANALAALGQAAGNIAGSVAANNANSIQQQQLALQQQIAAAQAAAAQAAQQH